MSNQVNTRGRGEARAHTALFFFLPLSLSLFLANPYLVLSQLFVQILVFILFLPSLLHIVFKNRQMCKVVWYCNYPFLGMNSFFFLTLPNYTVCVSVCLREKESQVSVPWAFLCLSLKTDGWRSASVSLASPVALDNNTLPRRSGGREQTGGSGCGWRGLLKKRKLDENWREIQLLKYICVHLCLNLNSKE